MTFRLLLSAFAALAVLLASTPSFAGLMVVPQRIVMDAKTRSTVVLLMNTDKERHAYRIRWVLKKMDETGKYKNLPLDEKNPHSVPNMVVFSPRQIQLDGNGRQNVRLSLRMPSDLPAGEYRAHLQFDALPDEKDQAPVTPAGKGVAFNLKFLVGTSIPVIVRTGGESGDVAIADPALEPLAEGQTAPGLHLNITHKLGANSIYGRLKIFLKDEQIGLANNVAIYPEQEKRGVTVPLNAAPPSGSTVRIVYEGAAEYAGKVLAEQSLTIP